MKRIPFSLFSLILLLISCFSCGRRSHVATSLRPGTDRVSSGSPVAWREAMGIRDDYRIRLDYDSTSPSSDLSQTPDHPNLSTLDSRLPTLDSFELFLDASSSFAAKPFDATNSRSHPAVQPVPRDAIRASVKEDKSKVEVKIQLPILPDQSEFTGILTLNLLYDASLFAPKDLRIALDVERGLSEEMGGSSLFYLLKCRESRLGKGIIPIVLINDLSRSRIATRHQASPLPSSSKRYIIVAFRRGPASNLKLIAKPVTADPENTVNLSATTASLDWNEARWGDWNNDGTVSAADVSPLGIYFARSTSVGSPDFYIYAVNIDGNRDGQVNAGDLSPVAFHFGESTGGYSIYQADDATGTNTSFFASLARPSPPSDPTNPPFNKSFQTLGYSYQGTTPPVVAGKFYRVVPFDNSSPPQESTEVGSSWVQVPPAGQAPIASLSANPTSGPPPLTVDFDGTGSTDPDGTIISYDFDFDGDGNYEVTGNTTGLAQFTYSTEASYTAIMRVTDNDGLTAQDAVVITVSTPVNNNPSAVLNANPTAGAAPLDVAFDGTASSDPDPGDTLFYEFDFTNDGIVDTSNDTGLANFTYSSGGNYTARLKVTDQGGLTDEATANIAVTGPVNQPPVSVPRASPTAGNPPLAVTFWSESADADGTIVLYEWDYDGDGNWDDTNTTGNGSYTYVTQGFYSATLRVTDDLGAADTKFVMIAASSTVWATETLDSGGDVGPYSSLAFNKFNKPGIAYYDATNGNLKYIAYDGSQWNGTAVDIAGDVGYYSSLAFRSDGLPGIAYGDDSTVSVKYASFDGTKWNNEIVTTQNVVGFYATSLDYDSQDYPGISYFGWISDGALKFAKWSGSTWNVETVDDTRSVSWFTSLKFDNAGSPAIGYRDYGAGETVLARWNGSSWDITPIPSPGDDGSFVSLAIDPNGYPALAWYEGNGADLMYASWNGTGYDVVTVDSAGDVGSYNSLAFGNFGRPMISYYDFTNKDLKFAYFDGSTWQFEVVDSQDDVGPYSSLAVNSVGTPAISYYDATNMDLKHSYRLAPP